MALIDILGRIIDKATNSLETYANIHNVSIETLLKDPKKYGIEEEEIASYIKLRKCVLSLGEENE